MLIFSHFSVRLRFQRKTSFRFHSVPIGYCVLRLIASALGSSAGNE
jgi:hypothetical protein